MFHRHASSARTCGILILAILLISVPVWAATAEWEWQNPSPTGNTLLDVIFLDANTAVAVGDGGHVLRSQNQGRNWHMVSSNVDVKLQGVDFCDALNGMAAGRPTSTYEKSAVMVTSDGGWTWDFHSTGLTGTITDIACLSPTKSVVVGLAGRIAITNNGGLNWSQIITGDYTGLFAVDFPDANTGYAVGDNGRIIKTTDGGATWTAQVSGSTGYLRGVDFIDVDNGWVVGVNGEFLTTTDGGTTWNAIGTATTHSLIDVVMLAGGHGFAASFNGDVVLHTTNGGASWTEQFTGQDEERLQAVASIDGAHAVTVGGGGLIFATGDGGAIWEQIGSGFRKNLHDVALLDEDVAVAVGLEGSILKTTDGGENWLPIPSPTTDDLNSVHFVGTKGLACGNHGTILRSENGGDNWTAYDIGTSHDLRSIHTLDGIHAVAVGYWGMLLTTDDGGVSWTVRSSGVGTHLNSVWMVNATDVMTVGDSNVTLRSTDGGLTWSPVATPVTQRLIHVMFVNEDVGFILGTYTPVILRTEDGGLTWVEYTDPLGGATNFGGIAFQNENVGMISAMGRWLSTFDGGDTWIVEPAVSGSGFGGVEITPGGRAVVVGIDGNIISSQLDPEIVWTETVWPGANSPVYIGDPLIYCYFDQVLTGGEMTVTARPDGPFLDGGFSTAPPNLFYYIETTADFIGEVELIVPYDDTGLTVAETELKLYHFDEDMLPPQWVDVTTQVDVGGNYIYGVVTSFSPFAVVEPGSASDAPDRGPVWASRLVSIAPTPFNPRTTITFEMARAGRAEVSIYDVRGRLVSRLADKEFVAGRHELVWKGEDGAGRAAESGVYLVRFVTDGGETSRKVVLVR